MDFGAVVCKPKLPHCGDCFLKAQCTARLTGLVDTLPVKKKSAVKRTRWFYYLVVEHNGKVYIRKRRKKDIWENLYEFILIETKKAVSFAELKKSAAYKKIMTGCGAKLIHESALQSQQLTHQSIQGRFIHLKTSCPLKGSGYKLTGSGSLSKLPFPKFITGYFSEKQEWSFG